VFAALQVDPYSPASSRRETEQTFFSYATLFALAAPFSSICKDRPDARQQLVPTIQVERRCTVGQKKIVQPMIDEMKAPKKPSESATPPDEGPLKPAELDQDAGGGYNPDGTDPQP